MEACLFSEAYDQGDLLPPPPSVKPILALTSAAAPQLQVRYAEEGEQTQSLCPASPWALFRKADAHKPLLWGGKHRECSWGEAGLPTWVYQGLAHASPRNQKRVQRPRTTLEVWNKGKKRRQGIHPAACPQRRDEGLLRLLGPAPGAKGKQEQGGEDTWREAPGTLACQENSQDRTNLGQREMTDFSETLSCFYWISKD